MGLMQDKERESVRGAFATLTQPVHLLLFTSTEGDEYSMVARELLAEVAELHAQITLEEVDLHTGAERSTTYGVDQAPSIVFLGGTEQADTGMRFTGLPSGYEFASLVETMRLVGGATEPKLMAPLRLQVFVTPSCPYCPRAALLAGLRPHDPDACTCMVKRFAPLVYARALRLTGDHDEAESVLQTTFIKACVENSTVRVGAVTPRARHLILFRLSAGRLGQGSRM